MKSVVGTKWSELVPNEDHDWLNQRDSQIKKDYFEKCIPMGVRNDVEKELCIFKKFSNGITSGRDPWVYNSSYVDLIKKYETNYISLC